MESHLGPRPHTTIILLNCWYGVLFMKCYVGFMLNVTKSIISKRVQLFPRQSIEYFYQNSWIIKLEFLFVF